jgi:hypothetical protein
MPLHRPKAPGLQKGNLIELENITERYIFFCSFLAKEQFFFVEEPVSLKQGKVILLQ